MLTDQIKKETKTAHQELEKLLVYQIKSIETTDDYLKILTLFYLFFAPLEKELFQTEKFVPDIRQRRKSEAITQDIKFLGSSAPFSHASTPLLSIKNPVQALGVLYVMEGSTMGGPIISRMVSQKLQLPENEGFKFFNGYGETTNSMWEKFKGFINHIKWTAEEETEIIDAATHAFSHFKKLIINKIDH